MGVVEVRHSLHYRSGTLGRFLRLEDSRANENAIHAELHHESCVRRCRNSSCSEIDHRKFSMFVDILDKMERGLHFFGVGIQLGLVHGSDLAYFSQHSSSMLHSLPDVTSARFAFGPYHCSS